MSGNTGAGHDSNPPPRRLKTWPCLSLSALPNSKKEGSGPSNRRSQEGETRRTGRQQALMKILKSGALYFVIVFGAGFVLGPIRTLWAVPHFGTRMAELMETPIMLVVTILAARWVVRRLAVPPKALSRLGMGCIALGLMLIAEFGLVLWLRGLSISEYLASRDPVSGTVYYVMLGVFCIMPLLVSRR
jgi:hypothetical protein